MAVKNFLQCVKCSSPKIKIAGVGHKPDRVGVKLKCECGASETLVIPVEDFKVWIVAPEIKEAMKIFEKPKEEKTALQGELW